MLGLAHVDLDLARLEVRVDVLLVAADDLPRGAQHVLGPQPLRERKRRRLGVERQLDDPGAVAQVDEDDAAMVAPAVHPPGHAHVLIHPRGIQLAGPGVAVQVGAWWSHKDPLMWCMTVSGATSLSSPPSRSRSWTPSSPKMAT